MPEITLDTPIKQLKNIRRNTLFLLKELGALSMRDILNVDCSSFIDVKGVGKRTYSDLKQFQETYKYLLETEVGMNGFLEKAAQICLTKHKGQTDKVGKTYFLHPMRVAMACSTDEERIVAMLHDTIEDTDVTPEYLISEGFPQYIVDAIRSVTKREGETCDDFIKRCALNPIGRQVKLRDLEDNMNVLRLNEVSDDMAHRLTKYIRAHRYLTDYK